MRNKLLNIFDRIFSRNVNCSVGDIILQGQFPDIGQFTVYSRYYDILRYKKENDKSFPFQNAISYCLWGAAHDESSGNKGFEAIITSYDQKGYDKDSKIILWNDCSLANGTHRVGLNLYHKIWGLSAKILIRSHKRDNAVEYYKEKGLSNNWIGIYEEMQSAVENVLFEAGACFVVVICEITDEKRRVFEDFMGARCKRVLFSNAPDSVLISRFSLTQPLYRVKRGVLFSTKVISLYKEIESLNIRIVDRSVNCTQGQELWMRYMCNS